MSLRFLLIDPSSEAAHDIFSQISASGLSATVDRVQSPGEFEMAIEKSSWNLIISEWQLPDFSASHALRILREHHRAIPLIVCSLQHHETHIVTAIRHGAVDFVSKSNLARLPLAIRSALGIDTALPSWNLSTALPSSNPQLTPPFFEEQKLHSHKLETVGRLAGGIAHDFNNLLMVMGGYCRLLMDQSQPKEVRHNTEQIFHAVESASALTRRLLAFSRKDALLLQTLDVNQTIRNLQEMLQRLIGEDIELRIESDPRVSPIHADPTLIEQILINLSANARDAMPEGGILTLRTQRLTSKSAPHPLFPEVKPGKYVLITVHDSGVGISREVRARMFEPFYTTKDSGKGTGLGLDSVRTFLEQMNGHIAVESQEGQGSSFHILLPASTPTHTRPPPDTQSALPVGGHETILLVEDQIHVQNFLKHVLENNGYKVLTAYHGTEAIQLASNPSLHPIHLLLTDVIMPQMDGVTLCKKLTQQYPSLRTILISGYTFDKIASHGVEKLDIPLLTKPIRPDVLLSEIRKVLDTKKRAVRATRRKSP